MAGLAPQRLDELLLLVEIVGEVRGRRDHRRDDARQRLERFAARANDERLPRLAAALERRHETGAHERRLTDAGATDDGHHRPIANTRDHRRDFAVTAEELAGVVLLERGQTGVRALVELELDRVAAAGEERLECRGQLLRRLPELLV